MVEICIDGVWGTVCDYFNEWNDDNAAVICRQLNLPTSGIVKALKCKTIGVRELGMRAYVHVTKKYSQDAVSETEDSRQCLVTHNAGLKNLNIYRSLCCCVTKSKKASVRA